MKRVDHGLLLGESSGRREKWMESECILNVRTIGFPDRLDLDYENKGIKDDSRLFCPKQLEWRGCL